MKNDRLGRGLDSLFSTDEEPVVQGSSVFNEINISHIEINPNQPRHEFDQEALDELAISIQSYGIISPITVRKMPNDMYQIIAGERRFRAAKQIELDRIPAYIKTTDDDKVLEMALIENIQREDLNAIEIALTYNTLAEQYHLTQQDLSDRLGKKRATIANYLRLLKLPAEIQVGVKEKKIDMGHARALAGVDNVQSQLDIYAQILKDHLSVRRTEELVRRKNEMSSKKKTKKILSEEDKKIYESMRHGLSSIFESKIKLTYNEKGCGKIAIPFKNDDDLMRIMELMDKIKS